MNIAAPIIAAGLVLYAYFGTAWGWRVRATSRLAALGWPVDSAWEYSAGLYGWAVEAREEWGGGFSSPAEAISADQEYWEE